MASPTRSILGYGSATLVQGASGFVVVPFLLTLMGPTSFASWVMLEPIVATLAGAVLLGLHYGQLHTIAIGKMSLDVAMREFARHAVGYMVFLALLGGLATSMSLSLPDVFVNALLLGLLFILEAFILLSQFHYRAIGASYAYAATIWLRSVLVIGGVVAMAALHIRLDLGSYLVFLIGVDVVVGSGTVVSRRKAIFGRSSAGTLPSSRADYLARVRYGLPMVISAALAVIVGNGDRYVVNALMPASQLPAYVVMTKLAGAMAFAMAPINLWWPTARHKHIGDADGGEEFFRAVLPILFAYYMCAAAVLWIMAQWLVPWYAPGVSGFDALTLLVLVLGGVALGMNAPVNIGTLEPGKTHWTIVTVALAAMTGVGTAILLIPVLGYLGAALAALIGQAINLLSTFLISQRLHPIRLLSGKLLAIGLVGASSLVTMRALQQLPWAQVCTLIATALVCGWLLRKDMRLLLFNLSSR